MNAERRTLDQWLRYIEALHPVGIDLGLERVGLVARQMGFYHGQGPAPRSVIVAGTNGKGSTCIALEALLSAAGLTVGTTLSPHLHRFNERIRIGGAQAGDATIGSALACVEHARAETAPGGVPLTYFEFSALAALACFRTAQVDVAVLEVGLGGRLDAFNVVDADLAVITSIGLDHQAFLGDDLEVIGREKAGVMRPGQRVVLGADVTESVVETAGRLGCRWTRLGQDFEIHCRRADWDFSAPGFSVSRIPQGPLAPANCALALEAARALVPLAEATARSALAGAWLPGRMERWRVSGPDGPRLLVLDVAHNPAGAGFLRTELERQYPGSSFVAILGMLEDKDCAGVTAALEGLVRDWVCVGTHGSRALTAEALAERLAGRLADDPSEGEDEVRGRCTPAGDPVQGLDLALSWCNEGDAILTLGSFNLVEQVREVLLAGHADAEAWAPGVVPGDLRC